MLYVPGEPKSLLWKTRSNARVLNIERERRTEKKKVKDRNRTSVKVLEKSTNNYLNYHYH